MLLDIKWITIKSHILLSLILQLPIFISFLFSQILAMATKKRQPRKADRSKTQGIKSLKPCSKTSRQSHYACSSSIIYLLEHAITKQIIDELRNKN